MRWRPAGGLVVVAAAAIAGCTATSRGHSVPTTGTSRTATAQAVATPSCRSARLVLDRFGPVLTAHGDGIVAHGLVQASHIPPRPGATKIVWRVTGSGPLRVHAVGPGGVVGRLAFGPQLHTSSNFHEPGTEWGTGIRFTRPGCWRVRLQRGARAVTVVVPVARR